MYAWRSTEVRGSGPWCVLGVEPRGSRVRPAIGAKGPPRTVAAAPMRAWRLHRVRDTELWPVPEARPGD